MTYTVPEICYFCVHNLQLLAVVSCKLQVINKQAIVTEVLLSRAGVLDCFNL